MSDTDIDIKLLRSFLCVASEESVSRAARVLGCTQGTMSLRIAALERKLGVRLFHRGRDGVTATAAGRDLLPEIRTLVDSLDGLVERLRPGPAAGRVRLGVAETYADALLPVLMRRTSSAHRALELDIVCDSSDDLSARIEARALDLAIVTLPEPAPPAIRLSSPRMHWIAAPEFAFAEGEPVPIAWLSERCFFRRTGLTALKDHGVAFRELSAGSGERVVRAAVTSGAAVTVVPGNAIPAGLREVSPSLRLPALGRAPIQLLEGAGARSGAARAIRDEIVRAYGESGTG